MKHIVTLVFVLLFFRNYAADITIKVMNKNNATITLFAGTISPKENIYSDDETVFMREQLNISKTGRPIRPKKKGQTTLRELSNGDILIVFGMYVGGGRTEVWRYRVKDIERTLSLTVEKLELYHPAKYYIHIIRDLLVTNNAGSAVEVGSEALTGVFLYFNVNKINPDSVFVIKPGMEVPVSIEGKKDNEVKGFVRFDAKLPFMCDSQLFKIYPEEQMIPCIEIEFPGYKEISSTFEKGYKFLSWEIKGSTHVTATIPDNDYMKLFNSANPTARKKILHAYATDMHRFGNSNNHLYMIVSLQRTDNYNIIDYKFKTLQDTQFVQSGDLLTAKGNYRLSGKQDTIFKKENFLGHIEAIDVTPLLFYLVARYEPFLKEPYDAGNCIKIYEYLGTFIELPYLDEDALSLTNPSYTIEQVKEKLSDPEVEKKLNSVLAESINGSISFEAVDIADQKLQKDH